METSNGRTPEFHDAADKPEASYELHPVEQMEPMEEIQVDILVVGNFMAKVYAWVAEGSGDLIQLGKRQWVQLYVLRPDLIQGQTLDSFGGQDGKTRQAMDKLVQDFQRTFHIKARNTRSNETRLNSQRAHLS